MKNLLLALTAIIEMQSFASTNDWFDAGIKDYTAWPASSVVGAGVWSGMGGAKLVGDDGAKRLTLTGDETLKFVVTADPLDVITHVFSTSVKFPDGRELADPSSARGGIGVKRVDSEDDEAPLAYFGIVEDGETNVWTRLYGAEPDLGKDVRIDMLTCASSGEGVDDTVRVAQYFVDGVALSNAQNEVWFKVGMMADDFKTEVAYAGIGEVAALSGEVEIIDYPTSALTIPEVEGATPKVTSRGRTIRPNEEDKYVVQQGFEVTVSYTIDEDYRVLGGETVYTITPNGATCALEGVTLTTEWFENFKPGKFNAKFDSVYISEFMAKNKTTIASKCGISESDWIELTNGSDEEVDLTGWALSDDPEDIFQTKLPAGTKIGAGETLLVFCDKKPPACEQEIHVKLSLSTDAGEYLLLTDPNANVTTKICYDAQMSDISCGFGHIEEPIKMTTPQYRIGTDGEWKETSGGIGMTAVGGYFAMKSWIVSSVKVPDFDTALDYVKRFEPTKSYKVKTISFVHSASGQKNNPVNEDGTHIGLAQGSDAYSDMVIDTFDAVINIPEAGDWTFAVSNAAYTSYGALGVRLELQRNDTVLTLENDDNVGTNKNSKLLKGTFPITKPGAYELKLTYSGGLNGVANRLFLFAGKVNSETDEVTLRLVNKESDSEALRIVGRPALEYATDVREEMLGKATKAEWRTTFTIDGEVSAQDSYYVKAQFADGLVAMVNGVVLKELATVKRSQTEELAWTEIMIPQDILKQGENEVVLTVENDAINDQELLANAVVVKTRKTEEFVYFPEPTPGNLNTTTGRTAPTKKVTLSEPHGYKTGAFTLTMSCADPEAKIYYTLDGAAPTVEKGILYEGPITISSTTCVRAAVPDAASILQNDTSATYLYLDDILTQPRYKSGTLPDFYKDKGFIATGNGRADLATGTQRMRYGFNSTILGQEGARKRVIDGMTNGIDTIALVIDPKNLFDKSTGIYRNAVFSGRAWERATMIEGICPTNSANDFAIQAGLRIRGGSSRRVDHPKHSFRFYFRSDYGDGDLVAKIFGDEGTDTFDKLDLRTSQNWSLSNENSRHDTFIHETFLRDTQRDMGEPYTRSRYYHLYINGIYWGLYETQERIDEDFSETYLGGDAENFDIIKRSMDFNGAGELQGAAWDIAAGTRSAYTKMGNLAVAGLETMEKYLKIQGLNADGTRNAEYPIYVNPENLMKYVLINHYTCNIDSPFGTGDINNLYAVRNRVDGEAGAQVNGFTFFCHDGEHSMGTDTTADEHRKDSSGKLEDGAAWRRDRCHYSRTDMTFLGTSKVNSKYGRVGMDDDGDLFGPGELNYRLMQNAEYKMAFADMVYKMCFKEGGALTVPVAKARFQKRMDEIDDAIMGEIARWDWDDTKLALPNHATWENACGECLEFIEKRLPYLIQGYREAGWYPTNEPPAIAAQDGVITLSTKDENVTLYYTLDGSDPRAVGGEIAGDEYKDGIAVPATGATVKVRSLAADGTWSALNELKVEGEVSVPTVAEFVRLHSFDGKTPTIDGDTDEWMVLTNLSSEAAFDLGGMRITFLKDGDTEAQCSFALPTGTMIPAAGSILLKQADFKDAGWSKITNNKIIITITDTDGSTVIQSTKVTQKNFTNYYGDDQGGRFYLRATTFVADGATFEEVAYPEEDEPEDPGEDIPEGAVVLTDDITGPTNLTAGAYYLKGANVTGGIVLDGAVTFHLVSNTTSQVDAITGANDLTVEGKGAISLTGANALMQVKNLTVNDGVLNVALAATVDKAKAIELTGNFIQNGGEITMDLTGSGVVYGIYQDTKKMEMKLNGGTFTATVAGAEKSAVLKGNKGSNDITFDGTKVVATLGGTGPRFATSDGKIKVKDGSLKLNSAAEGGENARALSANEKITISGGVMKSELTATGSEVLSCDDAIEVTGGVMSLVAADDCFSATGDITISDGIVQALSTAGDAIDSNGSITISGGYVFATTLSSEHEALDVDPILTEESSSTHKLFITGGTVVAAGGANMLHKPDEGSVDCIAENEITSLKKYLVLTGKVKSTKTILSVNLEAGKKRNADGFSLIATMPGLIKPYADTKTKPSEATPPSKKFDENIDGVFIRSYSTATLIQLF